MTLLLLAFLACPGTPTYPDDKDGDGIPDTEDCNSDNPDVFQGANDLCNGIDDDCDGNIDEDAVFETWWRDQDADNFGDSTQAMSACERPEGYVQDDTDCGAADPTTYPHAPEHCDGVDHDCDGTVNDDDAIDPLPWFPDQDGDGYGDSLVAPTITCVAPTGYVGNKDDCNDADALISPRAAEICDPDDADEDCDGLADEADDWFAGASQVFPDTDTDGFGDDGSAPAWFCDVPEGWQAEDQDCDDSRPAINPAAIEVCNGYDDDCDGDIDGTAIDARTWFLDRDEDGFGDDTASIVACGQPPGYALIGGDCDDRNAWFHPSADESTCDDHDYNCDGFTGSDDNDGDGYIACLDCDDGEAAINPTATEVCNGFDDNCDGSVDTDAIDAIAWYSDLDLDGYGDPNAINIACAQPYLSVADASDCNDNNPLVHPGVSEDCATPDDDNCDGNDNEEGAIGCVDWYLDTDGDLYGTGNAVCTCVALDGYNSSVGGDCNDNDTTIHPDAAEYCTNLDLDCDGQIGACDIDIAVDKQSGAAESDALGSAVGVADLNGDGIPDIAIGSHNAAGMDTGSGIVQILDTRGGSTLGGVFATIRGEKPGDDAGYSFAAADSDNDGYGELAIGAPGSDKVGASGGVVYLLEGPFAGNVDLLTAPFAGLVGDARADQAGSSVVYLGDATGDGLGDFAAGAQRVNNSVGNDAGAVYVFDILTGSGLFDIALSPARLEGEMAYGLLSQVAAPGDVDGDGIADLLAAAPYTGDGIIYLIKGPLMGTYDASTVDARWEGDQSGGHAGAALASAGDVDGDGLPDMWIGAPDAGAGWAYLMTGTQNATSLSQAHWIVQGVTAGDAFGQSLTGGQDIDGDGQLDVLIGAPMAHQNNTEDGIVYLINATGQGSGDASLATLTIPGNTREDHLGLLLWGTGDLSGNGQGDFLVGSDESNAGTLHFVLGEDLR